MVKVELDEFTERFKGMKIEEKLKVSDQVLHYEHRAPKKPLPPTIQTTQESEDVQSPQWPAKCPGQ